MVRRERDAYDVGVERAVLDDTASADVLAWFAAVAILGTVAVAIRKEHAAGHKQKHYCQQSYHPVCLHRIHYTTYHSYGTTASSRQVRDSVWLPARNPLTPGAASDQVSLTLPELGSRTL